TSAGSNSEGLLMAKNSFLGQPHPLGDAPGQIFLVNPDRDRRPRPGPQDECPFCQKAQGDTVHRLRFGLGEYLIVPNAFPLAKRQRLLMPAECRCFPTAMDVTVFC